MKLYKALLGASVFSILAACGGGSSDSESGIDELNDNIVDQPSPEIQLKTINDDEIVPFRQLYIDFSNSPENYDGYTVKIDGNDVTFVARDKLGIFLLMPMLNAGAHEVTVEKDGVVSSTVFTSSEGPSIEDPEAYVNKTLQAKLDSLGEEILTLQGDAVNDNTIEYLRDIEANFNKAKKAFEALTLEEQSVVAQALAASTISFEDQTIIGNVSAVPTYPNKALYGSRVTTLGIDKCWPAAKTFGRNVVVTAAAVGGMALSIELIVAPEPVTSVIGLLTGATTTYVFYSGLGFIENDITAIGTHCFQPYTQHVTNGFSSRNMLNQVMYKASNDERAASGLSFEHTVSRSFNVMTEFRLLEGSSSSILANIATLKSALSPILTIIPERLVKPIINFEETREEAANGNFSIASVAGNVTTQFSGSSDSISLGFDMLDFSKSEEHVSLTLVDSNTGIETALDTTVSIGVPVTYTGSFDSLEGNVYSGQLNADYASRFEIINPPSYGVITITNPEMGSFTYTQDSGSSSLETDSFTYVAINGAGYSEVAEITVNLSSLEDIEMRGDWVLTHIFSEPTNCHNWPNRCGTVYEYNWLTVVEEGQETTKNTYNMPGNDNIVRDYPPYIVTNTPMSRETGYGMIKIQSVQYSLVTFWVKYTDINQTTFECNDWNGSDSGCATGAAQAHFKLQKLSN